jgi:lysophospholipase L1-like esterase
MSAAAATKRARVLGWAIILLLPAVILAAVEGCVRLLDLSPSAVGQPSVPAWLDRSILVKDARWMERLAEAPGDLQAYYGTYRWDRHLFYRFRPDVVVPLTDALAPPSIRPRTRWILRTNSRGFPGPDFAPGPHPGIYRIVALGDSSTFGWGVDAREAYPAVLGEELRRRHPGRAIEVVNLGVCGYSSLQGRVLLEREALAWRPDLVTLSYGSNDWSKVPEPFHVTQERNEGWTGALRAILHRSRAYEIYASLLARASGGGWRERIRAAGEGAGAEMPLNVGPERSRENLRAMIRRVREAGADPVVVTNCMTEVMIPPVAEAAGEERVPFVETRALLRAHNEAVPRDERLRAARARVEGVYGRDLLAEHPDLAVYLTDGCHPNPVGHRILALELARRVEASASFKRFAAE